jgi:hypothetical protein
MFCIGFLVKIGNCIQVNVVLNSISVKGSKEIKLSLSMPGSQQGIEV